MWPMDTRGFTSLSKALVGLLVTKLILFCSFKVCFHKGNVVSLVREIAISQPATLFSI